MACPACGAPTNLMDARCPECGRSFADDHAFHDRPLGVTLLALYVGIWGLLAVVMTLPAFVLAAVADAPFFPPSQAIALHVLSLLLPVMGVLYLTAAYGLWTRPRWGHPFAVTLLIAGPCLDLVFWLAAAHGSAQTLLTFGECLVAAAAVMYLLSDRTRTYFGLDA